MDGSDGLALISPITALIRLSTATLRSYQGTFTFTASINDGSFSGGFIGNQTKDSVLQLHRIRLALQDENTEDKLSGEVEVDETFIGGKARNMHASKRAERIQERGPDGKAIVAAV